MRGRFFTAALLQQPGAVGVPSRAALEQADVEAAGSMHDPPLAPRDEAVFLLTAAAEIEHALMVQSCTPPTPCGCRGRAMPG